MLGVFAHALGVVLWTATATAAAPQVVVVAATPIGVSDDAAAAMLVQVEQQLRAAGLTSTMVRVDTRCENAVPCLQATRGAHPALLQVALIQVGPVIRVRTTAVGTDVTAVSEQAMDPAAPRAAPLSPAVLAMVTMIVERAHAPADVAAARADSATAPPAPARQRDASTTTSTSVPWLRPALFGGGGLAVALVGTGLLLGSDNVATDAGSTGANKEWAVLAWWSGALAVGAGVMLGAAGLAVGLLDGSGTAAATVSP